MAILGPNGAGKSTLIKAMLELIPRVSGKAEFFGKNLSRVRKRIAYMPQSASIDWDFPARVKDVVLMGTYTHLGWLRRPGKKEHQAAQAAMEQLDISDLASRQISELSGGQKQRLVIANALASQAELYVFDEPTSGVDYQHLLSISSQIRSLAAKDKAILIISHDLEFINEVADYQLLLQPLDNEINVQLTAPAQEKQ